VTVEFENLATLCAVVVAITRVGPGSGSAPAQGYSVLVQQWNGQTTDKVVVPEHGPMIVLRHPQCLSPSTK